MANMVPLIRGSAAMNTDFRIQGLEKGLFARFMAMSEEELQGINARWVTADARPGYPCRVSLQDAMPGERVLLIHFLHHDVDSPYRAGGPIFVREHADTAVPGVNEIPEILPGRLLSVRSYDRAHMMIHAQTIQGSEFERAIRQQLSNGEVAYMQVHNASPGCFSCTVSRA